jgi:hypothetical protein
MQNRLGNDENEYYPVKKFAALMGINKVLKRRRGKSFYE